MAIVNAAGLGLSDRAVKQPRGSITLQARAGVTFDPGCLVIHRAGSNLAEVPLSATPQAGAVVVGVWQGKSQFVASSTADTNGGALDTLGAKQSITVERQCFDKFATAASGANQITDANMDAPCWAWDNNTLYATSNNGTLPFAGFVYGIDPDDGLVQLTISETTAGLSALFSPGDSALGFTQDDSAAYVATSIPAGTFSGGVLTLTATGAFSTTQDGQTPALGDKFILPVGTVTTLVVSAANAGLYQWTSLGATGVSATAQRCATWAQGATIRNSKIRVSFGTIYAGTVWSALPATAALLVGTGDASLYPDSVVYSITLSAGTHTIATPVRSIAGFSAIPTMVTGGTADAATTSYQAKSSAAGITIGGIGTGQVIMQAQSTAGVLDASDVAKLNVKCTNG